jgi:hypothetical protein
VSSEVLYARINSELKEALERLAEESHLPLGAVAEIVIARGLGMESKSRAERVNALIEERYGVKKND